MSGIKSELEEHLQNWRSALLRYRDVLGELARAKADLDRSRAVFILKHRAMGEKVSHAQAESAADADDDLYEKELNVRVVEAEVTALDKSLRWYAASLDAMRTTMASEREENKFISQHGGL